MAGSVFDLNERVVVITGASGNLGGACARVLHGLGARLVLTDRSGDKLQSLFAAWAAESGGGRCLLAGNVDLGCVEDPRRVVEQAVAKFGRVDVLVNCVGTFRGGVTSDQTPESDWDMLIEVNLKTTLRMCAAVLPGMAARGKGSIVNVSSRAATRSSAGIAAYAASKAAVMRLTESIAGEYSGKGVTANCVLPDTLDTPENRRAMPGADPSGWVQPESVAGVVAFLLSDAACDVRGVGVTIGRSI